MTATRFFYSMSVLLGLCATLIPASAQEARPTSRLSSYAGQLFSGTQDPDYSSYEQSLSVHVAKRIERQFGIALYPKAYSGYDLLEIEAFFKCKKANEPPDVFLKMFPKQLP